jgi:hypothetical protein
MADRKITLSKLMKKVNETESAVLGFVNSIPGIFREDEAGVYLKCFFNQKDIRINRGIQICISYTGIGFRRYSLV